MSLLTDARMFLGLGIAEPEPETPIVIEDRLPRVRSSLADGSSGGVVALEPGMVPFSPGGATLGASPFGWPSPPPAVADHPPGRVSWDTSWQIMGAGTFIILPPDDAVESWRALDLDARTLRGMSATRLLRVLADASPDVSRALWDFLRLANPGWEASAFRIGTKEQHRKGQKLIDAFMTKLADKYGSPDVVIGKIHFQAFLFGMMFCELVLDEEGREALDLVTPDPTTIRFMQRLDAVFGPQWILGQYQMGRFVQIGYWPTIRYVAIDPPPGQAPYGRPPAAPALFSSLFLLGMLQDLRRVVAQQGYPRYDLAINLSKLREEMSNSLDATAPGAFKQWVQNTINEVSAAYTNLNPDSAFIHTDVVTVNRPAGAVSSDVLSAVDSLIKELERQLVRALKTMPLLMASAEGGGEGNSNRQWEIFARGISSIQALSGSILSRLLTLMCEAEGVSCTVEFNFSVLRGVEEYRDAQTDAQKIQNAQEKYRAGWIGQEEASLEVTGHVPDMAGPREEPTTEGLPPEAVPANPMASDVPPSGVVTPGSGSAPDNPDVADAKGAAERRYTEIWVRHPGGGMVRRNFRLRQPVA